MTQARGETSSSSPRSLAEKDEIRSGGLLAPTGSARAPAESRARWSSRAQTDLASECRGRQLLRFMGATAPPEPMNPMSPLSSDMTKTAFPRRWFLFPAIAATAALGACIHMDSEHPCGEGATLVDSRCEVVSAPDAGCPREVGTTWPADAGAPTGMGAPCTSQSDCVQEANYCAQNPSTPTAPGQCTLKDCQTMPESCPPGYRCMDVTAFGMGSFCIPDSIWEALFCQ